MTNRFLGFMVGLTALVAVAHGQVTPQTAKANGQAWKMARTPDGKPDLQGYWANNNATPLERPKELAGRATLTDEEVAAMKKKAHELFGGKSDAAFGDTVFLTTLANVQGTKAGFKSTDGDTGIPATRLNEGLFEDGLGVRRLVDPRLAAHQRVRHGHDPRPGHREDRSVLRDARRSSLICSIFDPITKQPYSRDPRHIAKKAEAYLRQTGIADTSFMGPEAEFFVFDDVRFDQSQPNAGYYYLDSDEGAWNSGREEFPNLGYKTRHKEGYFPVPPTDTLADLRQAIMTTLMETRHRGRGRPPRGRERRAVRDRHEVQPPRRRAPTSSCGSSTSSRTSRASTARRRRSCPSRSSATTAAACTCHQSLWKEGKPLFGGDGYAGLVDTALHYIGGIIKHAKSIAALTNPTTNSYRRLVPGFEAPVNLAYSSRNRSASVRIPITGPEPEDAPHRGALPRPELQPVPRLQRHADGGARRRSRTRSTRAIRWTRTSTPSRPEELKDVPHMPGSLEEALDTLERDHEFLLRGDVFTKDAIHEWLDFKRNKELNPIRMRPTPYEFYLYFDI